MGKKDKAQASLAGRVPIVEGGKPLLYPRYNSIDALLQIAKGGDANANREETDAAERPSKKQKRSAAAATNGDAGSDEQQADAVPQKKGYGAVDEDGLTYKQRRQMRRAAERAAKAQAEAEAAAAAAAAGGAEAAAAATSAATAPDATQAPANGDAAAPAPAPAAAAAAAPSDKKDKKKDKRKAEESAAAAEAAAKGNAEEAARMRALLGFSGGGAGAALGLGSLSFGAVLAAPAAGDEAAEGDAVPAAGGEEQQQGEQQEQEAGDEGSKKKKQKKEKKIKKEKTEEEQKEDKAEEQQQQASVPAEAGPKAGSKGGRGGKDASKPFSFEFKIQAAVEAETEARLARIMALDATKDGFVPRRIYVSGLPHEYDEATIREYWGYCGDLEDLHMMAFADSGNFNGTAFITFKTQAAYESALACNGEMLEGRALRVEKCKAAAELKGKARLNTSSSSAAAEGAQAGRVAGYPVVYCGNLSFEAGSEELKELFCGAGAPPTVVRLHTDKASGRSKGYAHVHFSCDEDVDKAVALDGTLFHGRKIRVSYAQPKPGDA